MLYLTAVLSSGFELAADCPRAFELARNDMRKMDRKLTTLNRTESWAIWNDTWYHVPRGSFFTAGKQYVFYETRAPNALHISQIMCLIQMRSPDCQFVYHAYTKFLIAKIMIIWQSFVITRHTLEFLDKHNCHHREVVCKQSMCNKTCASGNVLCDLWALRQTLMGVLSTVRTTSVFIQANDLLTWGSIDYCCEQM